MFSPASSVMQHVRSGKLLALASTGAKRAAIAPELPTIDELGLRGFETSVWFGFVVPSGTPADVVSKLSSATHAVLDSPEVQEQFRAQGIEVVKSSSEQLTAYIRRARQASGARSSRLPGIKPVAIHSSVQEKRTQPICEPSSAASSSRQLSEKATEMGVPVTVAIVGPEGISSRSSEWTTPVSSHPTPRAPRRSRSRRSAR